MHKFCFSLTIYDKFEEVVVKLIGKVRQETNTYSVSNNLEFDLMNSDYVYDI